MSDLVRSVRHNLRQPGLLPPDRRLLLAVSGGVDSMVLLRVLSDLAPELDLKLGVAHADHQLRGNESKEERALVESEAAALHLPCWVGKLAVRQALSRTDESMEMAARRLRHRWLARTAQRSGFSTVLLAHHADDQAELIMIRLLRGTGSEGLSGMAWWNASPADPRIRLARPLLNLSRSDLEGYARRHAIPFRTDSSNADRTILRNRIRHELLPQLEREYNPELRSALLRFAEIVGTEAELANEVAQAWLVAPEWAAFRSLHPSVQRRVVLAQLWKLGHVGDFEKVEQLRSRTRWLTLEGGTQVRCQADGVIEVRSATPSLPHRATERLKQLHPTGGTFRFASVRVQYAKINAAGRPLAFGPHRAWFDAEKVGDRIVLRHWRAGDRFQPLGFRTPSKLQNLFVNRRVPAAERRNRVVATTADGTLFWVEGLPPGEAFKVQPSTQRLLSWSWKRQAG